MNFLASLNEMSAAEGFPVVVLGALQAFGALALIVAVLVIMDKVYKKNNPDNSRESNEISAQKDEETGDNK